MTDLDDALASSAPVYYPATLTADWAELPPGEVSSGNVESPRYLSGQIGPGGWTVTHSLDDGLPDPVTMTNGNDASGKLEVALTGRGALMASILGWRSNAAGGTGTGTSFTATTPSDSAWGDYSIIAIAVNSAVEVMDANANPALAYGWQLLGSQDDGAGLKVWIWGRDWYASAPAMSVALSGSAAYSWVAVSTYARAANGVNLVPIRPGIPVGAAESSSVTSHNSPSATLDRQGYLLGIWASTGGTSWTTSGGHTEINEASSTVQLMVSRTNAQGSGSGGLTAVTASATGVAAMMTLPLRVMERPAMSARRYFSPMLTDSPVYGWDRDTASVFLAPNIVTASGIQGVPLFSGLMADIGLDSGGTASMPAVSRTRINLNATTTLPTITKRREGCSVDTLATYLMAQGGVYAGPGPSENTIVWAPMYDSTHAFMDGSLGYGRGFKYFTLTGGAYGWQPPETVPGPFVGAMYGFSNADATSMPIITFDRVRAKKVPGKVGKFNDFLSQQNTKGRLEFWVRGDFAVSNPWVAANDSGNDFLFAWTNSNINAAGQNVGGVSVRILNNRKVRVSMGQASGFTFVDFTGSEIPQDDSWHFVGVSWDWSTSGGLVRAQVDGWTNTASSFSTDTAVLPTSEDALYLAGGYWASQLFSRLPVSDCQIETGPECWSGVAFTDFARFWPSATDVNAVYRRSGQTLEAIYGTNPVNSWDTLADLAQSTLTSYRCDENDNYNWMPLEYFGEDAQMTSSGLADTELNAGELNVTQDASKVRNVVTVQFQDTRVDTNRQPVLSLRSSYAIPKGTTTITFPTDIPVGEVHGSATPYTSGPYDLTLLTSVQVAGLGTIPNDNYVTVNTVEDGSGLYLNAVSFSARVVGYDASTVTVQFTNKSAVTVYLTNNGQEVSFLQILGYGIRTTDGYTTMRDSDSVARRRERPLSAEMGWIQTRTMAEETCGKLLNITTTPRPEMSMRVIGDPRRKPGQLITVLDSEETAASGTWRILKCTHDGDGAQYTNDLSLVQVNTTLIWGAYPGWGDSVWG